MGYIHLRWETIGNGMRRYATRLVTIVGTATGLTALAVFHPILGLLTTTALIAVFMLFSRNRDDGLDVEVEVLEDRGEVVLVARARYGLGLDIHTTDYGFLIRNAKGVSRKVRLGFHPVIVDKKFQNGVMVLVCRKPAS